MADYPALAKLTRAMRVGWAPILLLAVAACASPGPTPEPAPARPPEPAATAGPDAERIPPPAAPSEAVPSEPEATVSMPAPEPEPAPAADPEPAPIAETAIAPEPVAPSAPTAPATPIAAVEPSAPAAPAAPVSHRLSGQVRLIGDRAAASETVLYFVPDRPAAAPAARSFDVATRDKAFDPSVLVVPRGSTLRFPNEDPILHNVFSVSAGNDFDLGVYGPGSAPETVLANSGTVNVYCNVHHEMQAHVLVLDTPWYTRADAEGRFELADLPPGPGTLHAWHRQADAWSLAITEPANGPIDIELEIVRPELPAHLDKRGESYQRRDRDPYR